MWPIVCRRWMDGTADTERLEGAEAKCALCVLCVCVAALHHQYNVCLIVWPVYTRWRQVEERRAGEGIILSSTTSPNGTWQFSNTTAFLHLYLFVIDQSVFISHLFIHSHCRLLKAIFCCCCPLSARIRYLYADYWLGCLYRKI